MGAEAFKLTEEQNYGLLVDRDAVMEANAGSGKTRVIAERYLAMITEERNGAPLYTASQIAAITFTNKAAGEMRERIIEGLNHFLADPANAKKPYFNDIRFEIAEAEITTFHKFYIRILRDYADYAGLPHNFSIISGLEESGLANEVIENLLAKLLEEDEYRDLIILYGLGTLSDYFHKYLSSGMRLELPDYSDYESMINPLRREILLQLKDALHWWMAQDKFQDIKSKAKTISETGIAELYDIYNNINENITPKESSTLLKRLIALRDIKLWGAKSILTITNECHKTGHLEYKLDDLNRFLLEMTPEDYLLLSKVHSIMQQALDEIIERKKEAGKISYNDIMLFTHELFTQYPDIAKETADRFKHIMVDEFQDTSPDQVRILSPLLSMYNQHKEGFPENKLFIVGDPKQSIYAFKGAEIELFLQFQKDIMELNKKFGLESKAITTVNGVLPLKEATSVGKIPLSVTFRCAAPIVAFVNKVFSQAIKANKPGGVDYLEMIVGKKDSLTDTGYNGGVTLVSSLSFKKDKSATDDDELEAKSVICSDHTSNIISYILSPEFARKSGKNYSKKDILVLASSNNAIKSISNDFSSKGITHQVIGGKNYYMQREIQETISYLKLMQDIASDVALATVLTSYYHGFSHEELLILIVLSEVIADKVFPNIPRERSIWKRLEIVVEHKSELPSEYNSEETELLIEKATSAFKCINKLLQASQRISPSHLMSMMQEESDLSTYILSAPNPEKAMLNILKLVDSARQVQQTSFMDISLFIDDLDRKMKKEEEESEALPETDDSVKVMTIHQAKGLDSKIVVYDCSMDGPVKKSTKQVRALSLGDQGNQRDTVFYRYFYRSESGIPRKYTSSANIILEDIEHGKLKEERKRKSYVACTRPTDWLFIHYSYPQFKLGKPKEYDSSDFKDLFTADIDKVIEIGNLFPNLYSGENGEAIADVVHTSFDETVKVYQGDGKELNVEVDIFTGERLPFVPDYFRTSSASSEKQYRFPSEAEKSALTSNISGRLFFPSNLSLMKKDNTAYIMRYVMGFDDLERLGSIIREMDDVPLLAGRIPALRTSYYLNDPELYTKQSLNEISEDTSFSNTDKVSLPQLALGTLIHAALEKISSFFSADNLGVFKFDKAKFQNWLDRSGKNILMLNSAQHPLEIEAFLKVAQNQLAKLIQSIAVNATSDMLHIIKGLKEETLFRYMSLEERGDILGGKIDLYYIDEENKKVYVYDWKTYSGTIDNEAIKSHRFQLRSYLYLLRGLRKSQDSSTYRYIGKLIYIPVSGIEKPNYHVPVSFKTIQETLSEKEAQSLYNEFNSLVNNTDKSYYSI